MNGCGIPFDGKVSSKISIQGGYGSAGNSGSAEQIDLA